MLHPDLLEILACPLCESRPPLVEKGSFLVCTKCGHGFPIVDEIPHLLPEDGIEPGKLKELLSAS